MRSVSALVYDDEPSGSFRGSVASADPIRAWATHFGNALYLRFIAANSTDGRERGQANKEIAICERKLAYWQRHPKWTAAAAEAAVATVKAQWASGRAA